MIDSSNMIHESWIMINKFEKVFLEIISSLKEVKYFDNNKAITQWNEVSTQTKNSYNWLFSLFLRVSK